MRRLLTFALAGVILATVAPAMAQQRRPDSDSRQDEESAKRKSRDKQWNQPEAPLPALRNAGPCPYVKILYDAGRYMEFKDGRESAAAVAYTGEIQGLASGCEYKDAEPIRVQGDRVFGLG